MLQAHVPNVSSVFSNVCCKCIYLDVVYVSHICYKCFIWMLRMFAIVSRVFASVLDAYFKCFIDFHSYVANVATGCFLK